MRGSATIKDIAAEVGLSVTAVSLVLNDKPCRISEENRKRIKETARRLSYSPNYSARSLKTHQSMTIGLIVPNIASHFYSKIAKNLEEQCRDRGYALFITGSENRVENDCRLIEMLTHRGVDGLLLASSSEAVGDAALAETLAGLRIPCVLVGRYIPDAPCDSVRFDEEEGAYEATRYLLDRGHTRIGCIVNTTTSESGALRADGYRRAFEEAGLGVDPQLIGESDYDIRESYAATSRILQHGVSALFASSDSLALGAVRCIHDHNLEIPRDISVVGFDEEIAYEIYKPRLTVMGRDVERLARHAVEFLCARMDASEPSADFIDKTISPELIEGASVAPYIG